MRPVSVTNGDITTQDIFIYLRVVTIVDSLMDGLTCHEVCEKISEKISEVTPCKGRFNGFDHSWLTIKDRPKVVIDPYPWATASGPLLITLEGALNPWSRVYRTESQWQEDLDDMGMLN